MIISLIKQVCIPVGCVPPALTVVPWGGCWWWDRWLVWGRGIGAWSEGGGGEGHRCLLWGEGVCDHVTYPMMHLMLHPPWTKLK